MSSFKQNHVIERIWVEVNQRVNYPIKQALNEMADDEQINCDEPTCMYCVSWFSMQVATVGIK